MWVKRALVVLGIFTLSVNAEYKICATTRYTPECTQLQRGSSEVRCQYVQDSIECANRIRNGTADFGQFSVESVAHLSALNWADLTIIKELRHQSRIDAPIDFETVVLVKRNHTNGILGLHGKGYCHPGFHYGKSYRWTEKFLKYFERQVVPPLCNVSDSIPEIETASVSKFFSGACRPGIWSHDRLEDAQLKKKYPNLCELCDNRGSCSYNSNNVSKVFECMIKGDNVAVVSLQNAQMFEKMSNVANEYSFLCSDGTLQILRNNTRPCSWLKEPWDVIIANPSKSIDIGKSLEAWLSRNQVGSWQSSLFSILIPNGFRIAPTTIQSPIDYMRAVGRAVAPKSICEKRLFWCTTSPQEKDKCEVAVAGAQSSGVQPLIECSDAAADTVDCINAISEGRADFMGIDSNYGYLARSLYNLTGALYFETETEQYSSVVAVIHHGSKFRSFESLRGARACIPEFGGTASMAFVNVGKSRGFLDRRECRYGLLLSKFFGQSCVPGAKDYRHQSMMTRRSMDSFMSLCSFCQNAVQETQSQQMIQTSFNTNITGTPSMVHDECSADTENPYYGNDGALRCLSQGGEVAIVELQSLQEHAKNLNISEFEYRIICRNGSLASYAGFDVDLDCALTTIVDGEVIVRRRTTKMNSIINALSAMDSYFQVRPDFKMYDIYDSEKHLLFKDSTIGLIGYNEEDLPKRVQNYKQLFEYIDSCKQGNAAGRVTVSSFMSLILAFIVSLYLAF